MCRGRGGTKIDLGNVGVNIFEQEFGYKHFQNFEFTNLYYGSPENAISPKPIWYVIA